MKQILITFKENSEELPIFVKIIEKIREDKGITPLDEGFLTKACSEITGIKEIEE